MAEKIAKFIVRNHILVMFSALLLLAVSIFGFTRLEAGFGLKIWFAKDDPYLKAYEQYERDFGNDDSLIVVVHSKNGIFDQESVTLLREVTDKMWQISDVMRVDSLSNYQLVTNVKGDVVIEQVFPTNDPELIARRKEEVKTNEHIISYLISRDQTTAAIHAQLKPLYDQKGQYINAVRQTQAMLDSYKNKSDHEFHLAGPAALSTAFRDISINDLLHLTPLLFLLVIALLFYHFRSWAVSILLVGILGVTIFISFGIAGLTGIKFNSLTSCLPQILIAMTLAEGIHFLGAFYRFRREGNDKKQAATLSLTENMMPTFMTSLTTALGFITFCTSSLQPIRDLGILASMGVMLSWMLTISLLPVLLLYLPAWMSPKIKEKEVNKAKGRRIEGYMTWVQTYRIPILCCWAVAFAISLFCSFNNAINSDILNYFAKSTPIRKANDFMHTHFGGSRGLEIVFDSGKEDGVKNVEFLAKVTNFQDWVREQKHVTKVTSIVDIIEELNQAIDDEAVSRSRLPASNESVAQQLFLYSMSLPVGMGLNYWTTLKYEKMRMKILWDIEDSVLAEAQMDRFEKYARSLGLNATITGKAALLPGVGHHLISTFNTANLQALILVAICMIFLFRSWSIGLLSMIPNVVPPAFAGAIMVVAGISYDVGTILVMSVVMGIAVDDTIHFLSHYVHEKKAGKSTRQAIIDTFDITGGSITMTTVILVVGFGLALFSDFAPYMNFGILTAITLALALSADLMLLPAILLTLEGRKAHKQIFKT